MAEEGGEVDDLLITFFKDNCITIYVVLMAFQGAAYATKSVTDDKISTLLWQVFRAIRAGRLPDKIEDPK